jgi:hypothetical protein
MVTTRPDEPGVVPQQVSPMGVPDDANLGARSSSHGRQSDWLHPCVESPRDCHATRARARDPRLLRISIPSLAGLRAGAAQLTAPRELRWGKAPSGRPTEGRFLTLFSV